MIKPRNTMVVVRLIEKADYKVGKITVPSNNECYCEAEVVAVGPGNQMAAGARSETFDLTPGQRVWVKHKKRLSNGQLTRLEDEGLPYRDNDVLYYCFEQSSVIGVLAEPGESTSPPLEAAIVPPKSAIVLH